jgi:hypothetical protein
MLGCYLPYLREAGYTATGVNERFALLTIK